jgi:hypothetical protein
LQLFYHLKGLKTPNSKPKNPDLTSKKSKIYQQKSKTPTPVNKNQKSSEARQGMHNLSTEKAGKINA